MEWPCVHIELSEGWTTADLEELGARLSLAGALGWEERETPGGPAQWLVYFAPDVTAPERVVTEALDALAASTRRPRRYHLTAHQEADRDWTAEFRKHFKPAIVSEQFAVAPPWFDGPWPFPGFERLTIYPAMAFGCGSHETTRLALRALERTDCAAKSVLDVGTGSGILAIAAVRLGAARAIGVEVDAVAIGNARENRRLNGLSDDRMPLVCGSIEALTNGSAFDVIVTNILYDKLRPLLEGIVRLLAAAAPPSRLIVCGFLGSERGLVEEDFAKAGLRPKAWETMGEWQSVIAAKV